MLNLIFKAKADLYGSDLGISQRFFRLSLENGLSCFNSFLTYADKEWSEGSLCQRVWNRVWEMTPIITLAQHDLEESAYLCEYLPKNETQAIPSLEEAVLAENEAANELLNETLNANAGGLAYDPTQFVPATAPQAVYSRQQLLDEGFIKGTFYAEDPTTMIRPGQLKYDTLMGFDATLKQDNTMPQILIYHTHSQETYINSLPNDESTSIMGVGEHLSNILRTKYGLNVIHHMGKYDVGGRDYAYSNAMADIENVLAQNPTIEVIIDLHRDETNADTRLVTTIQDKTMAKFMFFNGLSYTRELGELTGLPNPYVQDNLSFAFQMQLFAEEYYPGLTRRIYLKGYRYNMHYRPKTLLIELGSQTNTVEEAMNSCEPLAHIISEVLSGANKE